ncbi:MAG: trypsin-like peptidase domain-containing protein [Acidobacteriia bacterium]|nr:trypsin-like peptidase domain-containing protein [Terriglobia bacterium]MBV8905431.1 trypsin-like peptidase domain-containing protein [Terriglobia bacterium]
MLGFGEIAERLRRSTVQVASGGARGGGASGVIWSADGLILTNAHVARSTRPQVELWDGRRFEARVTAHDPRRDLAALRIASDGLPAAVAGDSTALRPGEFAVAVGNPLGFAGAVSTGVIHSLGPISGMGTHDWVRATARLAPGNSGGPLANAQGHVIGLNTAIVNGLGLAVPSRDIGQFLKRGSRPRLGIALRPVLYDGHNLGLLILEVEENGAAANASLHIGDILVGAGGKRLESMDSLNDALDSGSPALRLGFLRGDRSHIRETVVQLHARAEAA